MKKAVNTGCEWTLSSHVSLPNVDELFSVNGSVFVGKMEVEKQTRAERDQQGSVVKPRRFREAIVSGDVDVLSRLLSDGANPDQVDELGCSGLVLALDVQKYDVARLLLQRGACPNARCTDGMFVLQKVARTGDVVAVDLLLAHGSTINIRARLGPVASAISKTPLAHSIERGNLLVSKLIITRCPVNRLPALLNAQDVVGQTPLHQVSLCRQYSAIRLAQIMLEKGSFVDAQDKLGRTPLFYAAECGNREMVRVLVHHYASLDICDIKGQTITGRARAKSHIHVAKYLDRKMKAVDYKQNVNCLFQAGLTGQLDDIKQLILAGALINMQTRNGLTVLHGAAKGNHLSLVRFLVASGARLEPEESLESQSMQTALNMAAESHSWDVTEYLLDAGGNPNASLVFFRNPAYHAAEAGKLNVLKKLSEHGCQMDQAIIGAAMGGHLDIVKYLLAQDISAYTKDRLSGLRPADCAILSEHFYVATYLLTELKVSLNIPTGHGDQYRSTLHCILSKTVDATNAVLFVLQNGGRLQAAGDKVIPQPLNCPELLWSITQILLAEEQPFSLRNCCRMTVRRSLIGAPNTSVQCLPLPSSLKSYLLFNL